MGSYFSNDKEASNNADLRITMDSPDWSSGPKVSTWNDKDSFLADKPSIGKGNELNINIIQGQRSYSDLVVRITCNDSNATWNDKSKTDDFFAISSIDDPSPEYIQGKIETHHYLFAFLKSRAFQVFELGIGRDGASHNLNDFKVTYSGPAFWGADQQGTVDYLIDREIENETMLHAVLQNFSNCYGSGKIIEFRIEQAIEDPSDTLVHDDDSVHETALHSVSIDDFAAEEVVTVDSGEGKVSDILDEDDPVTWQHNAANIITLENRVKLLEDMLRRYEQIQELHKGMKDGKRFRLDDPRRDEIQFGDMTLRPITKGHGAKQRQASGKSGNSVQPDNTTLMFNENVVQLNGKHQVASSPDRSGEKPHDIDEDAVSYQTNGEDGKTKNITDYVW